jgi:hypothetical protein
VYVEIPTDVLRTTIAAAALPEYLARRPVPRTMPHGQCPYGCVQRSSQRPAEARVRASLHLSGTPSPIQRFRSKRVEQDRLTYAAQPGQHQDAFRPASLYPLQGDIERGQFRVTPGKFWRALARSRRVRIPHRVHVSDSINAYRANLRFR